MNMKSLAAMLMVAVLGAVAVVPDTVSAVAFFSREMDAGLDTFGIGMEENGTFNYSSNVTSNLGSFYISSYNRTSGGWDTSFSALSEYKLHYGLGYFVYSSIANSLDFASYDEFDSHVNYSVYSGLNFVSNPLPVDILASEFCTNTTGLNENIFYVAQYNSTSGGYNVYQPNAELEGDFTIPACSAVWVYMLGEGGQIDFTFTGPEN